jgi:hypothetical protein
MIGVIGVDLSGVLPWDTVGLGGLGQGLARGLCLVGIMDGSGI